MEDTKVKNFIKKLIFNIVETIVIFMIGLVLKINYNYIIALMIIFFLSKFICGKPKHYQKAYHCFIWSALTFTSVYLLTDLHLIVTILLTIFTGFIVTGKADIEDMYLWKGSNSNYIALKDIVALSPNNPIILEHEEYWRKNYPMRFEIFRLYFRERRTYNEIMELKDLPDSKLIQRECKSIYDTLERPLDLPPIN
jgi:hypothetical protein